MTGCPTGMHRMIGINVSMLVQEIVAERIERLKLCLTISCDRQRIDRRKIAPFDRFTISSDRQQKMSRVVNATRST